MYAFGRKKKKRRDKGGRFAARDNFRFEHNRGGRARDSASFGLGTVYSVSHNFVRPPPRKVGASITVRGEKYYLLGPSILGVPEDERVDHKNRLWVNAKGHPLKYSDTQWGNFVRGVKGAAAFEGYRLTDAHFTPEFFAEIVYYMQDGGDVPDRRTAATRPALGEVYNYSRRHIEAQDRRQREAEEAAKKRDEAQFLEQRGFPLVRPAPRDLSKSTRVIRPFSKEELARHGNGPSPNALRTTSIPHYSASASSGSGAGGGPVDFLPTPKSVRASGLPRLSPSRDVPREVAEEVSSVSSDPQRRTSRRVQKLAPEFIQPEAVVKKSKSSSSLVQLLNTMARQRVDEHIERQRSGSYLTGRKLVIPITVASSNFYGTRFPLEQHQHRQLAHLSAYLAEDAYNRESLPRDVVFQGLKGENFYFSLGRTGSYRDRAFRYTLLPYEPEQSGEIFPDGINVFAVRGSASIADFYTDAQLALGKPVDKADVMVSFRNLMKAHAESVSTLDGLEYFDGHYPPIIFTGHSLGGYAVETEFEKLKDEVPFAFTFNPYAVPDRPTEGVYRMSVRGDRLSTPSYGRLVIPQQVGKMPHTMEHFSEYFKSEARALNYRYAMRSSKHQHLTKQEVDDIWEEWYRTVENGDQWNGLSIPDDPLDRGDFGTPPSRVYGRPNFDPDLSARIARAVRSSRAFGSPDPAREAAAAEDRRLRYITKQSLWEFDRNRQLRDFAERGVDPPAEFLNEPVPDFHAESSSSFGPSHEDLREEYEKSRQGQIKWYRDRAAVVRASAALPPPVPENQLGLDIAGEEDNLELLIPDL